MSLLQFYSRPLVAFDPTDKEHRQHWHNFVTTGGWGQCPVRFICPANTTLDIPAMVQSLLVRFYVQNEFIAKDSMEEDSRSVKNSRRVGKDSSESCRAKADAHYREAAQLRKQAKLLEKEGILSEVLSEI